MLERTQTMVESVASSHQQQIDHFNKANVEQEAYINSKTQGDWGEIRLEMLLEKAGLNKDIHFSTQQSYKDDEGNEKRPDFIINLPGKKHLVIDSKVSLVAYERYFNAETNNPLTHNQ